ncbi:MAG: hypothetical protein BYD32DRAFT_191236 [Podila humilis]|nr:MAG: hypothetical protein BYD32DRAFT_191236 [Podila humilis]
MELPWINSFYRMMIHRVANCFQLERRIDTTQKTITLYRTDQSALPAFRFVDIHHEEAEEEEGEEEEETPVLTPTATTVKPIKVLKRCPPRPASVCGGRSSSSSRADDSNQRTVSIKEREEAYAKARARIFQGTEHSAPETYMTKDQLMCPFVQQHLQQHHNHHHHIPHPTHLHHAPPPSQQHLYPPHHRPPPRQATYPVYGIISAPPPQTQHQGSPRQGHHGVGAYPMDLYPCSCMHHEGYSPDMGSIAPGFGHHPTPPPPHSHPQPVSPMRPSGGSQQSARARMPSTRGGSDGGGIQLPSYPVYDVDKRPPKSTELYDPKNPKCTTRKRG